MASSSGSIEPLSPGNVISASIRLYSSHLKQYLGIASIIFLWSILPTAVDLLIRLIFFKGLEEPQVTSPLYSLWAITRIVVLVLSIYCSAKALMNEALIARLAFSELVDRPETTRAARSQLKPIMFRFLIVQILLGLLVVGVGLGLVLVWFLLTLLISNVVGQGGYLITFLLSSILLIVTIALALWFAARWFLPEVALAVEENLGSSAAISRSWDLTRGHAVRVLMVILVAGLITLPPYVIAALPFLSAIASAAPTLGRLGSLGAESAATTQVGLQILGGFLISFVLFLAFNIFLVPFWQAVKSLIYFDLRSRREGLGLQLRDRKP